ncbi:Dbl homology domain-containing protein [Xylariaceae sp. FL0804]|nr:Dbl homology domain-containing protein [Xylariaceae sp. FL0804]
MALAVVKDGELRPCSRSSSLRVPKKAAGSGPTHRASALRLNRTDPDVGPEELNMFGPNDDEAWDALDNIAALGLNLENEEEDPRCSTDVPRYCPHEEGDGANGREATSSPVEKPFHKWMKNLHRRAQRPQARGNASQTEPFPEFPVENDRITLDGHRKSSSGSSYGFVAAVRSATVSLASASVMTRPRRHTGRSSLQARTDRSSRGSVSTPRFSEDSACFERGLVNDPGVTERLLQRRRILEELINTEECYIGDVRFLMNVYVTILASLPTPHQGLRSSINRNLTDIVELHEEILGELHRAVPHSEYTQPERLPVTPKQPPKPRHHRWRSLGSVPEDKGGKSWLQNVPSVIAEPSVAADVAQIFGKRMNRFFVYEEYGAKYEMMIKDVSSAHHTMPHWETYQKGLEALAASLGSASHHLEGPRKSLTIGDLLVKPIQRICRYPLLFAELLKYTPVCDCPNSHMEIENVLVRLREATAEINRATDDPRMKATMEQTWLLQDRLVFPNQRLDATSKSAIRSFGQVRLCGALHVCWQTRDGVKGQYMVALLYKECLCLATAGKVDQIYTIQACIGLDGVKVEEADNGRGLQCHTAPFSWKLVFECDHQLYELVMTACSLKEEREWRERLSRSEAREPEQMLESAFYSSVSLNIKSLGTVFGKPGTVARRLSIHRAITVGPRSSLCQVILKNTSVVKETSTATGSPINRSQSVLATNYRIPVLAPPRADRARLEALLADVWSRKVLPFPGISTRARSEHLVRSSASTMMRKLSVASITSSFTKRSASTASIHRTMEDDQLPHVNGFVDSLVSLNCDNTASRWGGIEGEEVKPKRRRLPMIRDVTERNSSASTSLLATDSGASAGTVRKLDASRLEADWCKDSDRDLTVLRSTSSNSVRSSPSIKSAPQLAGRSNESLGTDKPGMVKEPGTVKESVKLSRSPSKWSRVGAINKSLLALGSRSFFR